MSSAQRPPGVSQPDVLPPGYHHQSAVQRGPGAHAEESANVDHLQLRRPVDRDGAPPAHLHAGRRVDRTGDELVAGAGDHCAGNLIVLVPILLNAHPGTKYGIPFPVLARSSFGTAGANVPAILRAIVACGWFGIQTHRRGGGAPPRRGLAGVRPDRRRHQRHGLGIPSAITFGIFWLINIGIIVFGMNAVRCSRTGAHH